MENLKTSFLKKWGVLIMLGIAVFVAGGYLLKISKDKLSGQGKNTQSIFSSCEKNANPVFSHHITDIEKIGYVVPPGTVEDYGTNKVFKTHSYIKDSGKVPIYAPIDSTLFQGVYVTEQGINQYALFFEVTCEIFYLFDHVVSPPEKIKSAFPDTPKTSTETQSVDKVEIKAGELVGYSIGSDFEQWDFGVYTRNKKNNHSEIDAPVHERDKMAECPYDYFPEEKTKLYYSKFKSHLDPEPYPTIFCNKYENGGQNNSQT